MKTRQSISLSLAALCMMAAGCDNGTTNYGYAKPIVMRSEYNTKMANNTTFAVNLFKTTIEDSMGENIFISPYSINTAMSMVWNGAAGQTADELQVVLGNDIYTRDQNND